MFLSTVCLNVSKYFFMGRQNPLEGGNRGNSGGLKWIVFEMLFFGRLSCWSPWTLSPSDDMSIAWSLDRQAVPEESQFSPTPLSCLLCPLPASIQNWNRWIILKCWCLQLSERHQYSINYQRYSNSMFFPFSFFLTFNNYDHEVFNLSPSRLILAPLQKPVNLSVVLMYTCKTCVSGVCMLKIRKIWITWEKQLVPFNAFRTDM